MDRNGITRINVRAANVVHKCGYVCQLFIVVVALVEEDSDLMNQVVGFVQTIVSNWSQFIDAMSIAMQSESQIVIGS